MQTTVKCKRGCGDSREAGGIYVCCGTSPYGKPIEEFVNDPVLPYEEGFHRGPKIIFNELSQAYDMYMWISSKDYFPWAFVEEVKRFGLSRHVSNSLPLEKITPLISQINLVFPFAVPKFEFEAYGEGWYWDNCKVNSGWDWQQVKLGQHRENSNISSDYKPYWDFCTFAHKDLSIYLAKGNQYSANAEGTEFTIHFPNFENEEFTFEGYTPDVKGEVTNKENWLPGIILTLPITHIEIPYGVDEKDEKRVDEIAQHIPVIVMEY